MEFPFSAHHQQQLESRNDYELITIPPTPPSQHDYFQPPNVPVGTPFHLNLVPGFAVSTKIMLIP
jgi:hypothetical protein